MMMPTTISLRGIFLLLAFLLSMGSSLVLSVAADDDNEFVTNNNIGGPKHPNETSSSCTANQHLGVQTVDAKRFLQTGILHLRSLIIVNMPPFVVLDDDDLSIDIKDTSAGNKTKEENPTQQLKYYSGLMPDILREMQRIAFLEDGINLTVALDPVENSFERDVFQASLDDLAIDCNTTTNRNPWEDCIRYDLAIGPYWPNLGERSLKGLFTPPLMETGSATARYAEAGTTTTVANTMAAGQSPSQQQQQQQQIVSSSSSNTVKSLQVAEILGSPVCMDGGDFSANYEDDILAMFPKLNITRYCDTQQECLHYLQDPNECILFIGDELVLRYKSTMIHSLMMDTTAITSDNSELLVSSENIFRQYISWAINSRLDPTVQFYLRKWVYRMKETGFLDRLFNDYFSINYCPLGKAGENCDQPCHPLHGLANRQGVCICDSTKWVGDDCSIEVLEDYMLIPEGIKYISYGLIGINFAAVAFCVAWLLWNWNNPRVLAAQPFFLLLVLIGCLISTSTIVAMAQETALDDVPIRACMAVPWLYSVGFCITFGSLFAKIRRIYILFQAALRFQKIEVTTRDTLLIVGGILALDMSILVIWTVVEPLQWQRVDLNMDKYGTPLNSVGYCFSNHWMVFLGVIGLFHFLLMSVASYMCYKARNLPTLYYEGKYIAFAMISNLQIFVVAVPVMLLLGVGEQGGTSFALRSVVIWMNDFVVLFLIFGNLMGFFHDDTNSGEEDRTSSSTAGGGGVRASMGYGYGGGSGGEGGGRGAAEVTEPSTEERFVSKPEEVREMASPI